MVWPDGTGPGARPSLGGGTPAGRKAVAPYFDYVDQRTGGEPSPTGRPPGSSDEDALLDAFRQQLLPALEQVAAANGGRLPADAAAEAEVRARCGYRVTRFRYYLKLAGYTWAYLRRAWRPGQPLPPPNR
jgi:hypothetical protein